MPEDLLVYETVDIPTKGATGATDDQVCLRADILCLPIVVYTDQIRVLDHTGREQHREENDDCGQFYLQGGHCEESLEIENGGSQ